MQQDLNPKQKQRLSPSLKVKGQVATLAVVTPQGVKIVRKADQRLHPEYVSATGTPEPAQETIVNSSIKERLNLREKRRPKLKLKERGAPDQGALPQVPATKHANSLHLEPVRGVKTAHLSISQEMQQPLPRPPHLSLKVRRKRRQRLTDLQPQASDVEKDANSTNKPTWSNSTQLSADILAQNAG